LHHSRPSNMWSKWTQHLNNYEDVEAFKRSLRLSKPVLERIIDLLDERDRSLDTTEFALDAFESPSWPYLQAAIVGRRTELREIKKLLTLDPRKEFND
jgi:hypothetical protein